MASRRRLIFRQSRGLYGDHSPQHRERLLSTRVTSRRASTGPSVGGGLLERPFQAVAGQGVIGEGVLDRFFALPRGDPGGAFAFPPDLDTSGFACGQVVEGLGLIAVVEHDVSE